MPARWPLAEHGQLEALDLDGAAPAERQGAGLVTGCGAAARARVGEPVFRVRAGSDTGTLRRVDEFVPAQRLGARSPGGDPRDLA